MFHFANPAAQRLGHAQNLVTHALDGLGRALFGGLDVTVHFRQRPFQAVELDVGRSPDLLGHLGAGRIDAVGQAGGQMLQAKLRAATLDLGLGRAQPLVQVGEGDLQPLERPAGARLGLLQTFGDTADHAIDQHRGVGRRLDLVGHGVEIAAQVADLFAGAGLALVEMAGDLAERRLHGPQGLDRAWSGRVLFDPPQPVDHPGLVGPDLVRQGLEMRGHRGLFAFGRVQARDKAGDRLVDAADGQGGAMLSSLDPRR